MKRLALAAAFTTVALPALATPIVSGPGACGIRAVDNESFVTCAGDEPVQPVGLPQRSAAPVALEMTPLDAWRARHNIGARALLIDIRGVTEVVRDGSPLGSDANIPYLRGPGGVSDATLLRTESPFNHQFLQRMDEVLMEAGLKHGDPVILVCRTGELSRIAAPLLLEHGYRDVRIVTGGFAGATASVEHSGWKRAGLPWTRDLQPGWMRLAR